MKRARFVMVLFVMVALLSAMVQLINVVVTPGSEQPLRTILSRHESLDFRGHRSDRGPLASVTGGLSRPPPRWSQLMPATGACHT